MYNSKKKKLFNGEMQIFSESARINVYLGYWINLWQVDITRKKIK